MSWSLFRWFVSSATLSVPQAAAPVAFSLVSLSLIGETSGGAAMILAMTIAQVIGAVPLTRMGRRLPAATVLRLLVVFRTLALLGLALSAQFHVPFAWLVLLAALAGLVNGAAFGYLRALLNHFTTDAGLPRALGISATLNELTFVLGPVLASVLGSVSPVVAVLTLAGLGLMPALLIPKAGAAHVENMPHAEGSVLSPAIVLWLSCAVAGGAAVAAIEIGAVALALRFGYAPTFAILFTVPLCLASVAGGVWVSVRNRMASRTAVVAYLSIMSIGSGLAAWGLSLATTIAGAVLVGSVLAPLGTHYSLVLDQLAPPCKRPEVFALLRTANAVGVIGASAMLTAASLSNALIVVTCAVLAVTLIIAVVPIGRAERV